MHKLLALVLLALCLPANAEVWQARYGVAETFNFKLYNADGTLDVDEADGGTEVSLSCNEGAETTATNDFVDEGTFYSIALTATEMQCERIAVVVAATLTEVFFIQTSGNASAMTPTYEANVASVTADAITASAIAADAIGASELATDAIGAAEIAADAIGASELATDAIGAAEIAAGAIAAAEVADGAIDEATFATTAGSFDALGIVDQGTAQSATSTTLVLRSAAAFADDELIGATILITGGTGVGQARTITDYVSTTDTATVATWTTTPSGTITYEVFGTAPGSSGSVSIAAGGITSSSFAAGAIDAAAIAADAIGASEIAADAIGAGEIAADAIGAAEIAANAIGAAEVADATIDAATFAAGAIDATAIATDAIGAAEIAADAVGASEIAANAIGASEIADNAIDAASTAADFSTEVQDADIESINGVTINGDGGVTPFGP